MTSCFASSSFGLSLIILIATALLASVGAARAESDGTSASGNATVQIQAAALDPDRVQLAAGQHVVFRNTSGSMARVELDLARGEGLACGGLGETPLRARKFVVEGGAALECETPVGPLAYRVFRSGGGSVVESNGRIEIGSGGR